MAEISEQEIQRIVASVLESLGRGPAAPAASMMPPPGCGASATDGAARAAAGMGPAGDHGVFGKMEEAIEATYRAFAEFAAMSLAQRGQIIDAIRKTCEANAEDFSRRTREETGIGRIDHKIEKHLAAARLTPGIEDLEQTAWTGDHGLTVVEMAPYGVIGAVLPSTHPVPTLVSNAIGMLAAGNAVVFAPHPGARRVSAYAVQKLNQGVVAAGGPRNLISTVGEPTMESAKTLFEHPKIRLLVVTGGPGVVKAAMASSKKSICAGPGNPPVVVDETADIRKAARDTFAGAVFDNNVLCISEKEVFLVDSVADEFKRHLIDCGSYELSSRQMDELGKIVFSVEDPENFPHPKLGREFVGRDASVLAKAIGLTIDPGIQLLFGETSKNHVFVQEEQMVPCLPIVRCRNVDQAIEWALEAEHGFGHTAIIHSKNVENMSKMAKIMNTTIFVKNGPSMAGDGLGGEGYVSFSIASPTGEGITSTRTFTRQRRCVLVDYFRIV